MYTSSRKQCLNNILKLRRNLFDLNNSENWVNLHWVTMIILCPFYTKVDDTKYNLTIVFPTFMIYTAIRLKFNHTVSADEKYLPIVERAF